MSDDDSFDINLLLHDMVCALVTVVANRLTETPMDDVNFEAEEMLHRMVANASAKRANTMRKIQEGKFKPNLN